MGQKNNKWNKTLIILAIQRFLDENGRLPYQNEFNSSNGLPPRTVIKLHCQMTISEIFRHYFSDIDIRSRPAEKDGTYLLNQFKIIYNSLDYPIQTEYDRLRKFVDPNAVSSKTIIARNGLKRWRELLDLCGYGAYYKKRHGKYKNTLEYGKIMCTIDLPEESYESFANLLESIDCKRKK